MKTNTQLGFTLIEVLLSIAITATVMLTVGTTFHIMLNARDIVDDMAESSEAGPRILNLIERDLRGLWTYNIRDNKVFKGVAADVNGFDADRMNFLTTTDSVGTVVDLQSIAHKTTVNEVGYWFKPNKDLRDVFELWRREDPMVDGEIDTEGSFQLVHDRVKSFKVRYFETLGYSAEELMEWDSSINDSLPKRIKIEFIIERRRSSRNVVSDLEVEDFEGAEKSYVRHFVFDDRLENILAADNARIPVLPPPPEAEQAEGPEGPAGPGGPIGPAGPGGSKDQGERGKTELGANRGKGEGRGKGDGGQRSGSKPGGRGGAQGGAKPPTQLPPGFNFSQFFGSAGGNAGGLFGG